MTLLAGLVLGAAAAFAIWVGMQPVFGRPVSATAMRRPAELSCRVTRSADTVTVPPSGVNLIALERKL